MILPGRHTRLLQFLTPSHDTSGPLMKFHHLAILTAALAISLTGCGDPAPGENQAPTNVSETPGDDPFAGGGTDLIETEDGKAALTAPPIDLTKEGGGPGGNR